MRSQACILLTSLVLLILTLIATLMFWISLSAPWLCGLQPVASPLPD